MSGAQPGQFQTFINGVLDSFGNLGPVLMADCNTITPGPSQWNFVVTDFTGRVSFSVLITITGVSQNISATLQAAAASLVTTFFGPTTFSSITVGGTSTLTGNVTMGGTLGVTGATTLSSISTSGNATIGGTLGVTGNTTLSGTLGVTGASALGVTTFGVSQNTCVADNQTGSDIGAKVNTCISLGYHDILISTSNLTLTTQILINNFSNLKIHGIGGETAIIVQNGITGASAACAVKITGTSQQITFEDWEIDGNSQTGSGGNGNGVCIYGTGAKPSEIKFNRFSANFHAGATNGISGTGAAMPAAGVSLYQINTVDIKGGQFGGNQIGIQGDTSVFHVKVSGTVSNTNLTSFMVTKNTVGHWVIEDNQIENNGSTTGSAWINFDGCLQDCAFTRNYAEGNCGEMLFTAISNSQEWDISYNHILHVGACASTGFMLDSGAEVDLDIHNNWFTSAVSLIDAFDFNPSTRMGKRFRYNILDFSAGTINTNAINWQAGTHTGPCIIEGNVFGSPLNPAFAATNAIDIANGVNGCRVANNTCSTSSGTIGACVKVETGATNTFVNNTLTSTSGGTITAAVTDNGTNTTCIGAGCFGIGTVPAIYKVVSQKAETGSADANVLTLTPPANTATYRVCTAISVSAATAGIISWTLSWTDSSGNAQANIAQPLFQYGTAAPNTTFTTSAAGNYEGCSVIDTNAGGGNIVVKWVGGGTTTAKMSATIERIQ